MTIERVFLWFCKENDFYLQFREIMRHIDPKHAEYMKEIGIVARRDATFSEFFDMLWLPCNGGYGLNSVFNRLSYMAEAVYYQKKMHFKHYEKIRQLNSKWRYFLKNNLILSPKGLNVDDLICFNSKDYFKISDINSYSGHITMKPVKGRCNFKRDISFHGFKMTSRFFDGFDIPKDVLFYIRRKKKIYCGH